MVANIVNTLIGIVLVYAAVLKTNLVEAQPVNLLVASILIVGCALWARTSDAMGWFSATNVAMGVAMAVLAALQFMSRTPELFTFWGVFWVGLIVAVVALWAALYRPKQEVVGAG